MTTVRFWTIIGEPQSGKSRTVRELASLAESGGQAPSRDILLRGSGFLRVYAKRMAWQENQKSPADSVAEIRAKIATVTRKLGYAPYALNVLSTLRYDAMTFLNPSRTYPKAEAYLAAWVAEGWLLESLALMSPDQNGGRDHFGAFGAPTAWIYDARDLEIGHMVGAVRNHFGWA